MKRQAAWICLVGCGLFLLTVVALHGFQPGLRLRDDAVSYYVHGTGGWLLTVGLLALGFGSLALSRAFPVLPDTRAGRRWLMCWGAGVLLGGIFPADPPGHWDRPPSLSGMIHGNVALVAFLAFPVAALLLAGACRRSGSEKVWGQALTWLAWASAGCLVTFFGSLAPALLSQRPPVLLGLTERLLLGVYLAWLFVAAMIQLREEREAKSIASQPT